MKTLISQAEFVKLVNGNQSTISKYIKQGKLPVNGKKLIMPDAEKAYHMIRLKITPIPTEQLKSVEPIECITFNNDQLSVPLDKMYSFKCNDIDVSAHNFTDWKSVNIYTDNVSVGINKHDCYTTAEISLIDPATINDEDLNYIYFEIVPDGKIAEVSKILKTNDFDCKYYLITESEFLEFLKTRKPL